MLLAVAAFFLAHTLTAYAHGANWFPLAWEGSNQNDDRWVEYWLDSGNNWNSTQITAVDVADSRWSDIDTADGFVFDRRGYDDWDTCFGVDRDNVVSKANLGSGTYGTTLVCPSVSGNAERFHIKLNTTDYTFYWGSGSSYPAGDVHARGVLTHEFGHAAGGWLEPFAPSGHWDEEQEEQLCQHDTSIEFHTMCGSVSTARSWKQASLETHDVHTFVNAYPRQ